MVKIISLESNLSKKIENSSPINKQYTFKNSDLPYEYRDTQKKPDKQPESYKASSESAKKKT